MNKEISISLCMSSQINYNCKVNKEISTSLAQNVKSKMSLKEKWHRVLGHINF